MPKRYLGNIITDTPTAPAGPYETSAASGVWSLAEANAYTAAGLWPTAGNPAQYMFTGVNSNYERISMNTLGNGTNWGSAYDAEAGSMACSSSTRGIWAGGSGPTTQMQYLTFSTSGSGADFGDLLYGKATPGGGCGNSTRGLFGGGQGDPRNSIQYITIASLGNAADFGDLTEENFDEAPSAFSSTTRAIWGCSSVSDNRMDYVTISSTGNAADFGDLTQARKGMAGCSNSTRGLSAGGWNGSTNPGYDTIDYVTIASTGNATDFGNLTGGRRFLAGGASSTIGMFAGGSTGSIRNWIDYVTISTTGNAADWGTLAQTAYEIAGCSNAHGGLAA